MTMAAAFQRMNARMRRSMNSSPGNQGWSSVAIVLTYGVQVGGALPTLSSPARSMSLASMKRARLRPDRSTRESNESIHSLVSSGSPSGSWWVKPSITRLIMALGRLECSGQSE